MALTQDQSAALQRITSNVEASYQSLLRTKKALSVLIAAGKATCQEVNAYNLYTKAIYNFQLATLQALRGAGQTDVPEKPPAPLYVAWKGVPGEQAFQIDCAKAGLQGLAAAPGGDFYVGGQNVEWRVGTETGAVPGATISQIVAKAKQDAAASGAAQAGLGLAPIPIVIVGVIVALAVVAAIALTYLYSDLKAREEETKQMVIQAQQYEKTLAARASCFEICIGKGSSPEDCTKACATTLPEFDPKFRPPGGWGLFAVLGAVAVSTIAGIVVYKVHKRRSAGGGYFDGDDGDDGDYEDEDEDEDDDLGEPPPQLPTGKAYRMLPVIDV